jgi:hypothetical integral membrane protein (TIGR02206 family)
MEFETGPRPGARERAGLRNRGRPALFAAMDPAPAFRPYGTAHWVVIGLTVGMPMLFWATIRPPGHTGYRRAVRYGLAGLLLANWIGYEVNRAGVGQFDAAHALPMQLCDWAMFAVIGALVTLRRGVYEVAYFWGLAGTLQAILTPNLREGFPSLWFISFFVAHSGIVVGVLYLTAVEGLRPRGWAIARVMLWSEVYLGLALMVNSWTGANYGFLSHRPFGHSLLDYLSDNHGVYILEMNMLAVGFYLVLYLPFWVRDFIRGRDRV